MTIEDRIAEIRKQHEADVFRSPCPETAHAQRHELLAILEASQSRERALTEERDNALREADDQRCRANAFDRNFEALAEENATLTSENKALKEALRREVILNRDADAGYHCAECDGRWGLDETERHVANCLAALQQSQGGGK